MTMRQRKRARFTRQVRNVIFCGHGVPPGGYVLAGAECYVPVSLAQIAAADLDAFSRQLTACLTSVKGLTT